MVLNAASSRWGKCRYGKTLFRSLFSRAMCSATCYLTKPTIAGRCVCSRIGSDSRLPNEVAYRLWNWEKPWKECGSPSGSMSEIAMFQQLRCFNKIGLFHNVGKQGGMGVRLVPF
jgi:hypothetical protein